MTRVPLVPLALLLAVLSACAHTRPVLSGPGPTGTAEDVVAAALADAPGGGDLTGWFCPMHPDVTSEGPGRCRKCGMAFVVGNPFDMRDYALALSTSPPAIHAGEPFTLHLQVRDPDTGALVTGFEVVHDKRYHLFVVSQDLTSFQHVHPEQRPDGTWAIELTLPRAGYYRALSDFLPTGGAPQFLGRTLLTADYDGDLAAQSARIVPDAVFEKTAGSITAVVEFEPVRLVAGEYGHLAFTLRDAVSGAPIQDLEPYLGAFGHTLILSEDLQDYVHSHPTAGPESDISVGFGGPHVTFEGYMPRPGHYRAWSQFQRNGSLTTVSFTFRVYSLAEAVKFR